MMSAREYRARADALVGSADSCANDELVLAFEAAARAWRGLAAMADWQDAMQSALANSASE